MIGIQMVSQDQMDRLLEKQWRARIYLNSCPFRKALNFKWRHYYKEKLKQKIIDNRSRNYIAL